jgi:ANTAR domain-containing protein/GAF domain-containing protein
MPAMPTPYPPELVASFRAMAEIVYSGESYDSVYDAVCETAVSLVDGCDHASLMMRRAGRISTVGASDDVARHIDDLEKALGEGPCLDAIDEDEEDQHISPDLSEGSKWPQLAARILEETGVRGMAGFRLRQDGQRVGALNVFSDTAGALDEHSLEQAIMVTSFASVTLAAVARGEEATTLRRGLESNREIGKAVGMLMALHDIDDDRAFEMLAKVSQEMNVKVAEVAAQVVAHHRKKES